jgi:hypothetical protein
VRGTIYWDSFTSAGCTRLQIRYRNAANANLAFREFDECGPGGDANNSANRTFIDDSFGSGNLSHIVLTTGQLVNGTLVGAASTTITQVSDRNYPVTIQNGVADFGDGFHAAGFPQEPGHVIFRRNAGGTISSIVNGILYYDAFNDNSCSELILSRRNINGGLLNQDVFLNCGPGGNANEQANQLFVFNDTFTSGFVFDVRLRVADTALQGNAVTSTFGFAGAVGDFEVEPADALAEVNEPFSYPLMWTVPEPLNWHYLRTIELRIRDGATTILHLLYEEEGNLVSVFNKASGEFGRPSPVGSSKKLQTQYATVDLGESSAGPVNGALGFGPNSPTIRLNLGLWFKPSAAGKVYSVEVAATDDLGNQDPFAVAGTLTVPE